MASDELGRRVREILGELSGTILQDNPNYVMPTEEFLKAEQAIYDLMLEVIGEDAPAMIGPKQQTNSLPKQIASRPSKKLSKR